MIVLILSLGIHRFVALSLFHAMQALHILDSLPFVHALQHLQTSRKISWVQTSGALSTTILGNGGPAPSLSAVTFFVNLNSGATMCHGVPHKPSQFVDSQASLSVCLGQHSASHNSIFGNTQDCSCSSMMTDEDSLNHAASERTDIVILT